MFNEIFFEIMLEYALNILSGTMYYKNYAKQINDEYKIFILFMIYDNFRKI